MSHSKPLRSPLSLALLILAVVLCVVGAVGIISASAVLRGNQAAQAWTGEVEGAIEIWNNKADVLDRLFHSQEPWSLVPTFRYFVDGKKYTSSVWCYGDTPFAHAFETPFDADDYVKRRPALHADKPVQVFYNENNPSQAVILRTCKTNGTQDAIVKAGGILAVGVLVLLSTLIVGTVKTKRRKHAADHA